MRTVGSGWACGAPRRGQYSRGRRAARARAGVAPRAARPPRPVSLRSAAWSPRGGLRHRGPLTAPVAASGGRHRAIASPRGSALLAPTNAPPFGGERRATACRRPPGRPAWQVRAARPRRSGGRRPGDRCPALATQPGRESRRAPRDGVAAAPGGGRPTRVPPGPRACVLRWSAASVRGRRDFRRRPCRRRSGRDRTPRRSGAVGRPVPPIRAVPAAIALTPPRAAATMAAALGDRLAVGRVALDHVAGVRILLSQPFFCQVVGSGSAGRSVVGSAPSSSPA
jgi:hypothetical protein